MTVPLKFNFFSNARGLTFEDSASLTWALNANTNQLTGTVLSASAATSLAGGAAGSLPYQSAANTTAFLAAGTNGYLLTLSGGLPAWEAVPTWNQNTTGTAANVTGTVAIANGGTGQATALTGFEALSPMTTTGDMIYAPGAGTATRLPIGSTGKVLTVAGGIPSWATPSSTFGTALSVTVTGSSIQGQLTIAAPAAGSPALTVNGTSSTNISTMTIVGGPTAGQSNGLFIQAGVNNSGDRALDVLNQAATVRLAGVFGDGHFVLGWNGSASIISGTAAGAVTTSNALTVTGEFACNGSSPAAQPTGYGTPTGNARTSSFAAGGISLANLAAEVAQMVIDLKAYGIFGA